MRALDNLRTGPDQRVRVYSLEDDDPSRGGRLQVDVVDAGAGTADDLEVGGGGHDLGRHLGVRAHHQPVVLLQSPGRARKVSTALSTDVHSLSRPSASALSPSLCDTDCVD